MKSRKQWHGIDPFLRSGILVLGAVQIVLLVAALVDIKRRPSCLVHGKKRWWILGSFVDIFGPLAYFVFGRKDSPDYRKDFI